MSFYIGVVDRSSDAFGVCFPDLPGCTAMGVTMAELFANAIASVRDWTEMQVLDSVPPRTLDAIIEDAAITALVKEDRATFIQVPLLLDSGRSVRANISLDGGLLETIDKAADRLKRTRSAFLASAAREKTSRGM